MKARSVRENGNLPEQSDDQWIGVGGGKWTRRRRLRQDRADRGWGRKLGTRPTERSGDAACDCCSTGCSADHSEVDGVWHLGEAKRRRRVERQSNVVGSESRMSRAARGRRHAENGQSNPGAARHAMASVRSLDVPASLIPALPVRPRRRGGSTHVAESDGAEEEGRYAEESQHVAMGVRAG
uniref:Uncharacterized protein n=1 Tax=Arundo donax TaxID=35708 RepID=A0A0A9D8B7_ARUDO